MTLTVFSALTKSSNDSGKSEDCERFTPLIKPGIIFVNKCNLLIGKVNGFLFRRVY